jgi:hypothetical protein
VFPTSLFPPVYFVPRYWERPWFADAAIGQVLVAQDAADLHLSWSSTEPAGTIFQLYVNRRFTWSGTDRRATLPVPEGLSSIHVGSVPPELAETDFGAWLDTPSSAGNRARLGWLGGTYLDLSGRDDVAGFHIYGSPAAGQPPSMAAPLATLAAYPGGTITDGFGLGGFGLGGFGKAASSYLWTSARLGSGTWQFAVKPFSAAGNEPAATSAISVTITAPPAPPASNATGQRLTYTFNPTTHIATLLWLASTG